MRPILRCVLASAAFAELSWDCGMDLLSLFLTSNFDVNFDAGCRVQVLCMWDFKIQTDNKIEHNKPDITVLDTDRTQMPDYWCCLPIWHPGKRQRERERKLRTSKSWSGSWNESEKLCKVTVVPIIIRELQHQTFLVPRTPTGSIFAARQSLRMSRRSWAVVADFKTRVLRLKPGAQILGSSKSIRHIIVENVSPKIMFSS